MKVKPQRGKVSLLILDDALKDADVERHMFSVDGKENGVGLVVDVDEIRLEISRQFFI